MTKNISNRFGWLIVLGATLSMSDYSLYFVARHLGTPPIFAILGGVIFDGAALLFADYSLKHARVGSSGSGPRLGVFICAGLSAYLNSQHAVIANQIPAARIFWAAPPIIAVTAYEFHIKWERRRALANAGRIAPDLPAFGRMAWLLFPLRTFKLARTIVRYRMGIMLSRHTPGMVHERPPFPVAGSPELPAGSGGFGGSFPELTGTFGQTPETFGYLRELNPGTTKHAREWARARGHIVSDRGPLPADVLREYANAIRTPEPAEEVTDVPDTGPAEEGKAVILREVNGYDG